MPPAAKSKTAPSTAGCPASQNQPMAPQTGPSSARPTMRPSAVRARTPAASSSRHAFEPFGQVLQADQDRQQNRAFPAEGKHAAQGKRLGQEVRGHGAELRCCLVRPGLPPVEQQERSAAPSNSAVTANGSVTHAMPSGTQHERHRADQDAAAEGDDEVPELLFQPVGDRCARYGRGRRRWECMRRRAP